MVPDTHRQGFRPSSGLLGTDDSRKVSKMGVLKRLSFSFPPKIIQEQCHLLIYSEMLYNISFFVYRDNPMDNLEYSILEAEDN